jgi:hypothetical protein
MPTINPTVSEWFQTEYVTGVEHAFQQKGHNFSRFCRRKVISGATEAEFHQFGVLTAGPKIGGNIPRQKGKHSKVKIGTEQNFAMIEIDQYDLDQMAEDDRDAAKEAAGMALGRKADEIFLAAMALTDQTVLGGSNHFMGPGMSQEISRRFVDQHVTGGAIVCVISSMMWSHLMRFKEFANANYTGPSLPWMNADGTAVQARTWDGKHWIVYPDLAFSSGTIRRGYAWVPRAVGEVQLKDIFVHWSWENGENIWLGNHNFAQGNKILMPAGVVPFGVDESVAPEDIDPETWALAA